MKLASPKQRSFLEALANERVMPDEVADNALEVAKREDLTSAEASKLIDAFYGLPRRPKDKTAVAVKPHLVGLVASRYAYGRADLEAAGVLHLAAHNNQAFFRLKHWKDRVFLDQLHGAAPSFTRSNLQLGDEVAVASLMRDKPLAGVLLFSKIYTCCARCGAELTDQTSIDAGLGPTCRGYFGL